MTLKEVGDVLRGRIMSHGGYCSGGFTHNDFRSQDGSTISVTLGPDDLVYGIATYHESQETVWDRLQRKARGFYYTLRPSSAPPPSLAPPMPR
jgi:hypothetical protein